MSNNSQEKINVLFYCPSVTPEIFMEFMEQHKETALYEFTEAPSAFMATEYFAEKIAGIVLFSIKNKNELLDFLTFCKSNLKMIQQGLIKLAGFNYMGTNQLDNELIKNGVSELFAKAIMVKTFDYKMSIFCKAVSTNLKKRETTLTKQRARTENVVEICEALDQFSSDCWINYKEDKPRIVRGHWVIEMLGPSPYAGRWLEIKRSDKVLSKMANLSKEAFWEWIPALEEQFLFIEHKGRWTFYGQQPKFTWKKNYWKFMGISPALFFKEKEKIWAVRFEEKEGVLRLCDDSRFALAKTAIMEESMDSKYMKKTEGERTEQLLAVASRDQETETETETVTDIEEGSVDLDFEIEFQKDNRVAAAALLNGKNSTDKIATGPWIGKVSNSAENSQGGGFSATTQTDPFAGYMLSGQGSTDRPTMSSFKECNDFKARLAGELSVTPLAVTITMSLKNEKNFMLVNLHDVIDNILILSIAKEQFAMGSAVENRIKCIYGVTSLEMETEGKIVGIYEDTEKREICNVELLAYEKNKLTQFLQMYEERQVNIAKFFLKCQGIL
ncbi:MAG: hypothetical protein HQK52_04995 [Oligoflexia bacterium]|nr:hypothetical protein [Oligoflexia bacterium]